MRGLGTYYLSGLPNSSAARQKLTKANTEDEFVKIIEEYFMNLKESL